MGWPPGPASSQGSQFYLTYAGSYVIRWGTDGINAAIGNTANGVAIVVSCSPADEIETMYVENGTGMKVVRVMLWQGRKVNITIVDDSSIVTLPTPGALLTMYDPMANGTALTFRLLENSYNAQRKEPGQRVFVAEYLTMIEGAGTPPAG